MITKLLPQTRADPEAVTQMIYALHQANPFSQPVPTDLQKPLTTLVTIRQMVRVCMNNRENWDEYYLGLVIMLLGALKFKELDTTTRRLTLVAAAAVRGLITVPSLQHAPTPAPTPVSPPSGFRPKIITIVGAGLVILTILVGIGFWLWGSSPPPETPTPLSSDISVAIAPPATPTETPTLSPTPLPSLTLTPSPSPSPTPSPTSSPTPTNTPSPTSTWTPTSTSVPFPDLEWVAIPGGSFVMGSSEADIWDAVNDCNDYEGNCQMDWFSAEGPQRLETIGDFEITRYEITNAQYNLCVENGPCSPPRKVSSDNSEAYNPSFFSDDYPVVTVTAADAGTFCQWMGGRLPNEREWEKAARGPDGRRYPWGNRLDMTRANLYSGGPTKVGSYLNGASYYGLMDMAGNVAEFTRDNVVRGGSWKSYPHHGRTTHRSTGSWLTADFVNFDIGFRCVR